MTKSTMTLLEYLGKIGVDLEGDFLREGAQLVAQLAIELKPMRSLGPGDMNDRRTERTIATGIVNVCGRQEWARSR